MSASNCAVMIILKEDLDTKKKVTSTQTKWYMYMLYKTCAVLIIFKRDLGAKMRTNTFINKQIVPTINYARILRGNSLWTLQIIN